MSALNPTQLIGEASFGLCALICVFRWIKSSFSVAWLICALIFAALIAELVLGLRHDAQIALRQIARADSVYDLRRTWQAALLIVLFLAVVGTVLSLLGSRRGRRHLLRPAFWILAILMVFVVETISLHAVDAVLYAPLGSVLLIGWIWLLLALAFTGAAARAAAP